MKQTLEIVVLAVAVLLAALLFREVRSRAAARAASGGVPAVGETSDTPVPGAPPPTRAVLNLSPIETHAQPRVLRTEPPPPPPAGPMN